MATLLCRLSGTVVRPGSRRLLAAVGPRQSVRAHSTAKAGDKVSVHYTGTLDDGTVFDTSRQANREPLEFVIGSGMVIKGFDLAVTGLAVGGKRKERVEAMDAYGEVDPRLVAKVPKANAPPGLQAGNRVQLGNGMIAKITQIDDTDVHLDLNHELAGKALTFDVELMSITPGN